jgi:hypothetical protein
MMIYGGVQRGSKASAGIAILAYIYLKNRIHSYTWHNKRLLTVRLKIDREYLSIIAAYGPEEG